MEAAEEVARQLRLRDLGGLIVIDFIDMRENKHNHEVEKTLKQALKMDKARVNLGRISEFGMLEMSRQRIAKTLNDAIHLECPHCEGRGKVKSVEAMALSFLRKVHGAAAKGTISEVRGGLPLEVAYYLLNRKKRELTQIENDYEIEVTVKGKTSFLLNQLELETFKREKPRAEDVAKSEAESDEAPAPRPRYETVTPKTVTPKEVIGEEAVEGAVPAEGGKKRKRRRKKKKGPGDAAASSEQTETTPVAVEQAVNETEAEAASDDEVVGEAGSEDSVAKPKKRKRRRGKKGPKLPGDVVSGSEAPSADADTAPAVAAAPEPPAAEIPESTRLLKSRNGRGLAGSRKNRWLMWSQSHPHPRSRCWPKRHLLPRSRASVLRLKRPRLLSRLLRKHRKRSPSRPPGRPARRRLKKTSNQAAVSSRPGTKQNSKLDYQCAALEPECDNAAGRIQCGKR